MSPTQQPGDNQSSGLNLGSNPTPPQPGGVYQPIGNSIAQPATAPQDPAAIITPQVPIESDPVGQVLPPVVQPTQATAFAPPVYSQPVAIQAPVPATVAAAPTNSTPPPSQPMNAYVSPSAQPLNMPTAQAPVAVSSPPPMPQMGQQAPGVQAQPTGQIPPQPQPVIPPPPALPPQPVPTMPTPQPSPPAAEVPVNNPAQPMVATASSAPAPISVPGVPQITPAAPLAPPVGSVSKGKKDRTSLAIASLIVAVAAIVAEIFITSGIRLLIFVAPLGLASIGMGLPSLGSSRRGMAIAGVVLGTLSLVSVIILYTIGASLENQCRTNTEFAASNPQCQAINTPSGN